MHRRIDNGRRGAAMAEEARPGRRRLRTALGALTLASSSAWAGAPLVTETADVPAAGACELEAALFRATASGLPALRGLGLQGSCGIGGHSQLILGYERARAEGETAQSAGLSAKTTLVAPEDGRTGFGLRYGLSLDKAAGAGWRGEGLELLGVLTREIASGLLLHANLGHAYSRSARQGSTLWSLGVETTADTTLAADVFGDDRSRPWVSAGVGRKFGGGFSANASLAVNFEQPRVRQLTLGAKLEF